ncbi:hypothetical protein BC829DRAFT_26483 [Chytridium lagenaria]|nr:hypothetical protein BC829DRAFT_26483 [Chytridium lagenaria]
MAFGSVAVVSQDPAVSRPRSRSRIHSEVMEGEFGGETFKADDGRHHTRQQRSRESLKPHQQRQAIDSVNDQQQRGNSASKLPQVVSSIQKSATLSHLSSSTSTLSTESSTLPSILPPRRIDSVPSPVRANSIPSPSTPHRNNSTIPRPLSSASMRSTQSTDHKGGSSSSRTDSGFYSFVLEDEVDLSELQLAPTRQEIPRPLSASGVRVWKPTQQTAQANAGAVRASMGSGQVDRQLMRLLAENQAFMASQQQQQQQQQAVLGKMSMKPHHLPPLAHPPPMHPPPPVPIGTFQRRRTGSGGSNSSIPVADSVKTAPNEAFAQKFTGGNYSFLSSEPARQRLFQNGMKGRTPTPPPIPPPSPASLSALDLPDIVCLYMATAWGCTHLDPTALKVKKAKAPRQRSRSNSTRTTSPHPSDDFSDEDITPRRSRRSSSVDQDPSASFRSFVAHLVKVTATPSPLVAVSLMYLDRLRQRRPEAALGKGAEMRVFLAAMVVANKMFDDARYTSKFGPMLLE